MGAKPFFKIFQVPLLKGTRRLKVGQPRSLPVARETTKRYYTKVNKNGVGLINPISVRSEDLPQQPWQTCTEALFGGWSI